MSGEVLPAVTTVPVVGGGAILLPNTGGNRFLMVLAITSITVGGAILLSTVIRMVAKRAYKK